MKLADLRDQLLGDAVVLVLRLDPDGPPDPGQARGLLLLKARDPALLGRLIDAVNSAQQQSGELERVAERRRGETTYHVREFPAASGRLAEWFVAYPDGTFAFSNSEAMIQGVVDRKPPGPAPPRVGVSKPANAAKKKADPGLGDLPKVAAVRRRLPDRPLARLYVDPRAIERLLAQAPRSGKPGDLRVLALLERHLAAVEYAGAALVWRSDAILVHAVETLDPSRVDGWLRRWASDARPFRPELRRVPSTALAVASAYVDLPALREAVYQVVPEADQERLRNFETLLTGLLLGQELSSRILPALGPGVVAYVDAPAEPMPEKAGGTPPPTGRGGLFPLVVVVDLQGDAGSPNPDSRRREPAVPGVANAFDNALRTFLTVMALDEKRGRGRAGLATFEVAGASVTTLSVPIPFAYAIDRPGGRLILGSSAAAVARYLASASDRGGRFPIPRLAGRGLPRIRDVRLHRSRRPDAARRPVSRAAGPQPGRAAESPGRPTVEEDLEHVLALARLFRAAFVASRIEPDATAIHRTFGVILHGSPG